MIIRFTLLNGIIPALAGNTSATTRKDSNKWDHPRACGEHTDHQSAFDNELGSSPRLRGTLRNVLHIPWRTGIIPALAGNTCPRWDSNPLCWDHPRACGEHHAVRQRMRRYQGSSPRLRGTRHQCGERVVDPGIIPALAGNTDQGVTPRARMRDHPRACGEHFTWSMSVSDASGSSPRLRGTRHVERHRTQLPGIIPALAGNTPARAVR